MSQAVAVSDTDFEKEIEKHQGLAVVDFWATWCGPCVGMIPHEKSLFKRMEGRPLAFIGISDDEKESNLT